MAKVLVTEDYLSDIGDAIRGKLGGSTQYTPSQMASAINSIPTVAPTLISKSVVANGTYNASSDEADGYDSVSVNVPNSYASEDEGKVVNNGGLVAQESQSVLQNGTYNTTLKNQVVVSVLNTYEVSDNGKVVVNQALVAQTSKNINTNGTHDTTANNSVVVNVPNSYTESDEGKVVSSGALVSQTSRSITENGVYNTTENNQIVVNVSGGGSDSLPAVRVYTKSTGGYDAAMYVQKGSYTYQENEDVEDSFIPIGDPISVGYKEVLGTSIAKIKFFDGIVGLYYDNSWYLHAINKTISAYGIKDGEQITSWVYNTSKDIYIGKYPDN